MSTSSFGCWVSVLKIWIKLSKKYFPFSTFLTVSGSISTDYNPGSAQYKPKAIKLTGTCELRFFLYFFITTTQNNTIHLNFIYLLCLLQPVLIITINITISIRGPSPGPGPDTRSLVLSLNVFLLSQCTMYNMDFSNKFYSLPYVCVQICIALYCISYW